MLVGIAVVLGVVATVRLLGIARDLREARQLIDTASVEIEQAQLAPARQHLGEAAGILAGANDSLFSSTELDLVSWAPVVSSNLEALRDSVGHALALTSGGSRLLGITQSLESAQGTLEIPLEAGRIPLGVIAEASDEVQALLSVLPGADQRPGGPLFGPVRELQDAVYEKVDEQRVHLEGLSGVLRLMSDMGGEEAPRRYVLAVANTAEIRGSGGMVLSYGVLESRAGTFDLTTFGPIDELFLRNSPDPNFVPLDANEAARWNGLEPTRLFRNVNLIPDFSIVGPRIAAMYEVATGLHADGVIQVDVSGLAAILRGIGPVQVPNVGTVTAENIVDLTLNRIYFQFPTEIDQRREVLGEIAEAVFDQLTSGSYGSLRALGEALVDATNQRHLLVYAATQEAAVAVDQLHIDGELPSGAFGDSLMLTVQNFGQDKLDYYLDTAVEVEGSRPEGEFGELDVTVTVTNTAPSGIDTPYYVFGLPEIRPGRAFGTYVGVGSLYVPDGTSSSTPMPRAIPARRCSPPRTTAR